MSYYSVVLFVHIVGALGFFVALGVEWVCLRRLRGAATAEQVNEWMRVATSVRWLGMTSMIALLVSGIAMMVLAQLGGAWMIVAFWALVLLALLAATLSFRRMAAIARAASAEDGPLSPALRRLLHHPLLWAAIRTRVAIALGIVFLMTVKPELGGALLTIGVAVILGFATALPIRSGGRAHEEPAT
jgi:hypothetical protein